jgi:hypothetical protein
MIASAGTKAPYSTEAEPRARPPTRSDPCNDGGRYTSGLAGGAPATPALVPISLRPSAATLALSRGGEAGASEERSNEGGSLAVSAGSASGATGASAGGGGGGIDVAGGVGGGGVAGGAGGCGLPPGAVTVVERTGGMVTVTVRTVDPGGVVMVVDEPGGIVTVTVGT